MSRLVAEIRSVSNFRLSDSDQVLSRPIDLQKNSPEKCVKKTVLRYSNLTLNTEVNAELESSSGTYIKNNSIKTDKKGHLVDLTTESDLEGLEKEAIRIHIILPKIFEGSKDGKPLVIKLIFHPY